MKLTIDESIFVDYMKKFQCTEHLKRSELGKFYNALIELEQETGEEIELDPTALMCEYNFFDSIEDIIQDYGSTLDITLAAYTAGEIEDSEVLEALQEHTNILFQDDTLYIIEAF